jgi:thiamine-monophosphate kinase
MLLEGVHFPKGTSPYLIGRKTVAISLSDIAAMGGSPVFALCAVALPESACMRYARDLYRGMKDMADEFRVDIVGGNVASWKYPLCTCSTLIGTVPARRPIKRTGAKVGDAVLVTGELGGSVLGKHLRFTPRVKEALTLNKNYAVHSMIDISDGLTQDLAHLAERDRLGFLLYEEAIPVSRAAKRLSRRTGKTALEHALSDGEDFELLFSASPKEAKRILATWHLTTRVSLIGEITRRTAGYRLRKVSGNIVTVEPKGYVHFKK